MPQSQQLTGMQCTQTRAKWLPDIIAKKSATGAWQWMGCNAHLSLALSAAILPLVLTSVKRAAMPSVLCCWASLHYVTILLSRKLAYEDREWQSGGILFAQ